MSIRKNREDSGAAKGRPGSGRWERRRSERQLARRLRERDLIDGLETGEEEEISTPSSALWQMREVKKRHLPRGIWLRFALIALILVILAVLYLVRTSQLQLSQVMAEKNAADSGARRQHVITAPRGDIYDVNGLPLAVSESVNTLSLAYAGLKDEAFNRMLLDFAITLEEFDVDYGHAIDQYLDLDSMSFSRPADEVLYWQRDRNYLALEMPPPDEEDDWTNTRYAKRTPAAFYRYLAYTRFRIDQDYPEADVRRILRLRFEIYLNNWAFLQGTPVLIARDIPDELVTRFSEMNYRYQGALTSKDYRRSYTEDASTMAAVVGYVGSISAAEYQRLEKQGYTQDDIVGKYGVEASAERYLHPTSGFGAYNIWPAEGIEGDFASEAIGKAPIPGDSVRLTIDSRIQKEALEIMETMVNFYNGQPGRDPELPPVKGQAVMLDLKQDGAVIAMLNWPGFDPQDFIAMAYDEAAAARVHTYLTDNENKPMMNRAINNRKAPGSTFKVFTALGITVNEVASPYELVEDTGVYLVHGMPFYCRGQHGKVDLNHAIAYSCNVYFYEMGIRLGIDRLTPVLESLGLGKPSGIELAGEAMGIVPSRATKAQYNRNPGDRIWFPADTAQTAIGQGISAFTMLELAQATGSIASGLELHPHVIDSIIAADGSVTMKTEIHNDPLPYSHSALQQVRDAMHLTTSDEASTAYSSFRTANYTSGGKTGTAETLLADYGLTTDGLYIAFAPYEDPEVAVAVCFENDVRGASTSYLARTLFDLYFGETGYLEIGISAFGLPEGD